MDPSAGAWSADDHASDDGSSDAPVPVAPPTGILIAAGVMALLSVAFWIPGSIVLHLAGYVLATFVTLGLLAAFKRQDLAARQSPYYTPRPHLGTATIVVAMVAVTAAVAHIWVIATFMAG